ncbi:ornithine cyclodeaminase family protein, partial [Enterobacter mori]
DTPLRYVLPFNEANRYLVMPALSDELKVVGLKTVTVAPNNAKSCINTIVGSVILSDYETGETLAVLEGSYLTKIRTGA